MKHYLPALLCLLAASAAQADYTKIANNGWELPDSAALGSGALDWACTRDNATNLIWEVKTDDGGLRNKDNGYTNFDSSFDPNGHINDGTNSIGFTNAVNAAGLCGKSDWRMPSRDELMGLVVTGQNPTINSTYFPNTVSWLFWSGSPIAGDSDFAWYVNFDQGFPGWYYRYDTRPVRLVRAGQSLDNFDLTITPTGTGAGTIVIDGMGGNACIRANGVSSGTCTAGPTSGGHVSLVAVVAPGSTLTWGGACAGTTGATCTLTMDAAKSVTADFSPPPTATTSVIVDPDTPATLYVGLDGAGVYVSTNSAGSWSPATAQPTNLAVKALARRSGTPLYAGTYGGGVFKTGVGDTVFAACDTQPDNANVLTLLLDAAGKLYAGTEAGVFVSNDQCATWSAANSGLPY